MSCNNICDLPHSYKDIIQVFLLDFKKDFDCRDIEDTLRTILGKKEVDEILKTPQPLQTYILFWTLREQTNEIIKKFVEEGLKDSDEPNYGFLMSAIQRECRNPSVNTENYICEIDRLYNDNQKFSKYNVSRIEPYLELQNALLKLRPSKNIVVEGVLGAGKQWLALDVCSSFVVQRKMDFKIFWLDVHTCISQENCLEHLQSLLFQIDPNIRISCDESVGLRIERVKTELRHLLKNKYFKNCLLVLRNVQNTKTWEAFNIGCKILLTTRQKSVVNFLSPVTTTHIQLKDNLTPSEIESLLLKYIDKNRQKSVKEMTMSLINNKKTNPLQLTTIAESIRNNLCTLENWKQIKPFTLHNILKNSLKILEPHDKTFYEILFIFPDTAHIPLDLLGFVWAVKDPILIVNKLYKYSLVKKHFDKENRLLISLPIIYRELRLPIHNRSEINRKIINYYNIPKLFEDCRLLSLSKLDNYFYNYIGAHLSLIECKSERVNLFRTIFLDFRFLDQKIRNNKTAWDAHGSVLHTLQLLKFYRNQITDNDEQYNLLLNTLLIFLVNSEEKLIRSKFTSLLQIALRVGEGAVYYEALRQASKFSSYIWFTECGMFNQYRQVLNLGKGQAQHVVYLDNDYCLIALNSKQLLLTDVSLEGNMTYVISDGCDHSEITQICLFNKQMNLLTMHKNGSLRLWSLRNLLCRPHNYGSYTPVPPQLIKEHNSSKLLCYEQLVNSAIKHIPSHIKQNISSFFLDEKPEEENTFIQLHVAFTNGDICICDWENKEEKFKQSHTPILKTQQREVRWFSKILERFYVLCTSNCILTVWDLRCGSKETSHVFDNDKAIAMEIYTDHLDDGLYTMVILIFQSRVWRLKFKFAEYNTFKALNIEALPFLDNATLSITCGKLSKDACYLVLGTLKGLIVYDLKLFEIVLRSNVSEHIVCLDVYDLNGPTLKYIILCGAAGKNLIHLHTLRNANGTSKQTLTWMHNSNTESQIYLEPNVNLRSILKMSNDGILYTVDTKSRIHRIKSTHNQKVKTEYKNACWSMIKTPQMEKNIYITALYVCKDDTIYAGYNNGIIFHISENKIIFNINNQVDYLKKINSEVLVVSTFTTRQTFIFLFSENPPERAIFLPLKFMIFTLYAYIFKDNFLLLFTEKGVFYIDLIAAKQHSELSKQYLFEIPDEPLVGFDIINNNIFLAFRDNTIKVYKLDIIDSKLHYRRIYNESIKSQSLISNIKVSNDVEILSIGFQNGNIKIFKLNCKRLQHIYTITQGHEHCHRMMLRFSPCNQILVSCADQLCFWSVTHILNNQSISHSSKSERNNQLLSYIEDKSNEEVDACPLQSMSKNEAEHKVNPWMNKQGNEKKPELLAAIKYVGDEAHYFYTNADFTEFFVLDDENVFYHLRILEHLTQQQQKIGLEQVKMNDLPHRNTDCQNELHLTLCTEVEKQNDGIAVVENCILPVNNSHSYDLLNKI